MAIPTGVGWARPPTICSRGWPVGKANAWLLDFSPPESAKKVTETKTDDLMPPLIAALQEGATMGEITGVMRAGYGHPYDPFGTLESPI